MRFDEARIGELSYTPECSFIPLHMLERTATQPYDKKVPQLVDMHYEERFDKTLSQSSPYVQNILFPIPVEFIMRYPGIDSQSRSRSALQSTTVNYSLGDIPTMDTLLESDFESDIEMQDFNTHSGQHARDSW